MGAIDGSWAGLHGPGEKTIENTGQLGPGLYKELGAQEGARVTGLQKGSLREGSVPRTPALRGWQLRSRGKGEGVHKGYKQGLHLQLPDSFWRGPVLGVPSAGSLA